MKCIIEGHILKVIRMILHMRKTFISKENYVNCTEYRIAFIKQLCFLTTFANLEFHPSTWLFVHLSVSV